MLKRLFYLNLTFLIISCSTQYKKTDDQDFFRTESDSIKAQKIETNLIPMYSIAEKVSRKTIPEMMREDSIPGMSICFIDNGEIAWSKHYGYANIQDSIPINSSTVFTGASLSKPITAIAALRLVERGALDLDEDVNLVLKDWKVPETELTKIEKVTLRRLIGHEAGIKNDLWSSYLPGKNVPTLNQMLSGQTPSVEPPTSVVFEPGSKSKYSNPGYSIIQKLIIDVKNQDFDPIIEELVFEPAGMGNSSFKQPIPEGLKHRKAVGYTKDLEPYPYRLFPYQAAGGIWTTPTDLAKFMIALLNDYHEGTNTLLSKETTQSVFTKETRRYVFSLWNWGEDIVFQHSGSNQGFNCFMYGSVDRKQGIVVMTNSDNAFNSFDYIQRAVNDEYQWEYVKPEILNPTDKDISWADKYLGEYQWRGNSLRLLKQNEDLIIRSGDEKYVLTQTGTKEFILEEIPLKITFSTSTEDNRMTIWGPGGGPSKLKKTGNNNP